MANPYLLIVDDDPLIQDLIGGWFGEEFNIVGAHNLREVQSALQQMPQAPDYALVDLGLPPSPHRPDEGFAVIRLLQSASADCAIIVVSGQETCRHAQRARALGAGEYVEKPCTPEVLREKLLSCRQLLKSVRHNLGLIGESSLMQRLRTDIRQIAASSFPVLIIGETGTGKELVARALHESGRPGRPFLPVNCAAIPDHLAEPTLFGHVKGAFTGAQTGAAGLLGDADDGTLFLDEIGDLSIQTQGRLLRAIETGEYSRVGETAPRQCVARVLAATNRGLDAGEFRRDLYHRISAFTLQTPPLREMHNDRHLLMAHFREHIATDMQMPPFSLSTAAESRWSDYRFPGNIRELRNIVARLQVKYAGQCVEEKALLDEFCADDTAATTDDAQIIRRFAEDMLLRGGGLKPLLDELSNVAVRLALAQCDGDVPRAAALLSLSPKEFKSFKQTSEKPL